MPRLRPLLGLVRHRPPTEKGLGVQWDVRAALGKTREARWDIDFNPAQLANLLAWWRPEGTITSSGGAISQWNDSSSGGHNAAQSTGSAKPTLVQTNGLNAARGDGGDFLSTADFAHSTTELTVFVCGLVQGVATNQSFLAHWDGGATNARSWKLGIVNSKVNARLSDDGTNVRKDYRGNTTLTAGHRYAWGFTFTGGTTLALYCNGNTETLTKTTDTAITSIFESGVVITLMTELAAGAINAAVLANTEWHEGFIVNRCLSGSELTQVANYFTSKYVLG